LHHESSSLANAPGWLSLSGLPISLGLELLQICLIDLPLWTTPGTHLAGI
jgi:hypothetical protein